MDPQPQPNPQPIPDAGNNQDELLKLIQAQSETLKAMSARLDALEKPPHAEPPKIVPNEIKPEPPKNIRSYADIIADIKTGKEKK